MWTRKYRPNEIAEVLGQNTEKIKDFILNFKPGNSLFIYGPTGVGKTSSIQAIAKELDYDLIEINASDKRNQSSLSDLLSAATGQMSLLSLNKIILVDEVDGLSGVQDRGAIPTLAKFVASSTFPIVVTATDAFDQKLKPIKKISTLLEFNPLTSESVVSILQRICEFEKIEYTIKDLKKLALNSNGDARSAINDLQCSVIDGKLKSDFIDSRERSQSMESALKVVFESKGMESLGAYDLIDEDLDKIFLWLDENIPRIYTNPEVYQRAYDVLSLANVFFGRIRRRQYYRFYAYCYQLLSAGISIAKEGNTYKIPKLKESIRILRIWQANMSYAKRKSIVEKIALNTHTSKKRVLDNFTLLIPALKNNPLLVRELELDADELAWINKKY